MNALSVITVVAAFALAHASQPILTGPSGIITAEGPIGPEGLGYGRGYGLGAKPILKGPSGIVTSAGPIGPASLGYLGRSDDGLDGEGILKGPSGIITARGPIGPSGEMAGRADIRPGAILLGNAGYGLGGPKLIAPRLIAPRLIAPKLAASILLDGRLGGYGGRGLAYGLEGRLGLEDGRLGLADGRLGLLGLRGLEGSGAEGQYLPDLTEKLYDDGSYKPDYNGN